MVAVEGAYELEARHAPQLCSAGPGAPVASMEASLAMAQEESGQASPVSLEWSDMVAMEESVFSVAASSSSFELYSLFLLLRWINCAFAR